MHKYLLLFSFSILKKYHFKLNLISKNRLWIAQYKFKKMGFCLRKKFYFMRLKIFQKYLKKISFWLTKWWSSRLLNRISSKIWVIWKWRIYLTLNLKFTASLKLFCIDVEKSKTFNSKIRIFNSLGNLIGIQEISSKVFFKFKNF